MADVITAQSTNPNIKAPQGEQVKLDLSKPAPFSKDTVLFMTYLFYKSNLITRNHLKHWLKIIDEKLPANIAEWLVKESVK